MLKGRSAYPLGGVEVVLGSFGRYHHFRQGEVFLVKKDVHPVDALGKAQVLRISLVAQAAHLEGVPARLGVPKGKSALFVGYGPEVFTIQAHQRPGNGLMSARIPHFSADPQRRGRSGGQNRQQQHDIQQPFFHKCKDNHF